MESLVKAKYFLKEKNNKVKCLLCPRFCIISENRNGNCNARININGELFTLNYNKPVALNIDPIEKKPFFHFLHGSLSYSVGFTGCNLHCKFCQNWQISQIATGNTSYTDISPENIVNNAICSGCKSISFTYNEPFISYEMLLDTAKEAKKAGLYTLIVSNGFINREPLEELIPFISAANIDIKAFSDDFYRKYTGGTISNVLETLKILDKNKVHTEITTLLIPGLNDFTSDTEAMCEWIKNNLSDNVAVHFSRFFPQYMMTNFPAEDVSKIYEARKTAIKCGLKYVYTGNVPHNEGENTFCPSCHKKIVERDGFKINYDFITDGRCHFCKTEIKGIWNQERVKKASFAGSWYPAEKENLNNLLNSMNSKSPDKTDYTDKMFETVYGLTVPHAGYIYSGEIAASGFKSVKNRIYDTIVILGTSHLYKDNLISVFDGTKALFPSGELEIDIEITKELISAGNKILFMKEIHEKEHSLELQLPFIKYYFGNPKIVLILAATSDKNILEKCGELITESLNKFNRRALIVLSTDMSHYHTYEKAVAMDTFTINLILSGKYDELDKSVKAGISEMCGYDSFVIFRSAMKKAGAYESVLIDYKNSGDTVPESKSGGVVGYASVVFGKTDKTEEYSKKDKELLLNIARMTIKNALDKKDTEPEKPFNEKFIENRAVFVTLKIDGELRGCIGEMIASRPLYLSVYEMAKNAAFRDPRFYPLSEDEFDEIRIEISVLTPMKKIENYKEINLGIDGVLIYRDGKSGVFLPQVAEETGWNLETFMENLCARKAGLPKNAYKDEKTDIYIYQVIVISE